MSAGERPLPEVDGVTHAWVDAGGLRTHVALAGPEDGPPLVMVHGHPQHWLMWRQLIGPLAGDGCRIVCPDLRGYGWTEAPRSGYDPDTFARDLVALLDALGIERAGLIGHDWGGFASFLAACRQPQRVDGLLALAMPPPWVRPATRHLPRLWRFWYQLVIATPGGMRLLARGITGEGRLRRRMVGNPGWPDEVVRSYAEQFDDPERRRAARKLYGNALTRVEPGILRGVYRDLHLSVPTRLLWAEDDYALPPILLRGATDRADSLEVIRVPGCGHFIAEESPGLVLEHARELLLTPHPGGS